MKQLAGFLENTPKMPVLFVGHGSPINAIEENEFVSGFREISKTIETPKVILSISAHWETLGTKVTAMEKPQTIHDFGGFPKKLYEIQYPALGMPKMAQKIKEIIDISKITLDYNWGLDHGTWSVIRHMYPDANIPVVQLSLDRLKSPNEHYQLASELNVFRNKGVLIVGSGNVVHNLGMIDWANINNNYGYNWANETNDKIKQLIINGNYADLIDYGKHGKSFELSIPTPEHYLPFLYVLALKDNDDTVSFFNDKIVGGSISMTSLKIG